MNIKDFLNQQKIKELIAQSDLNAVYNAFTSEHAPCSELSQYLLDLGINPTNYFEDSIPNHAFDGCDNLTSVNILASVTTIGRAAFYYCDILTDVTFERNSQLNIIGEWAFYGCELLRNITIPSSVTVIGFGAFQGCYSLTNVIFEENSQLTTINNHAFLACRNLANIIIPNGVTTINDNAFDSCSSLTRIVIPDSVTTISGWIFNDCSKLSDINYTGTKAQWEKINKHRSWYDDSSIKVIHCVDGDISLSR